MAHLHATFTMLAYAFAGLVLGALMLWIAVDYFAQQKKLAALNARRTKQP